MKNLWLIAIGALLMTGCTENNSSNTSDEEEKESSLCECVNMVDLTDECEAMKSEWESKFTEGSNEEKKVMQAEIEACVAEKKKNEAVSTSNELKNPPRVESPADVNFREGATFLAENAAKEGVEVLESGVQLLELIPGNGKIPTMQNNVTVHYHGTLIDGTVFDSSVERAEPFTHNMSDPLIKGWVEGLLHMKTGAKYRVFMPASSGYGNRGQGPIGPNAALVFEIELISINS